jgi:hypothetical protein
MTLKLEDIELERADAYARGVSDVAILLLKYDYMTAREKAHQMVLDAEFKRGLVLAKVNGLVPTGTVTTTDTSKKPSGLTGGSHD